MSKSARKIIKTEDLPSIVELAFDTTQCIKMLSIDFDGTLVQPKDARPFPKDATDYQYVFAKDSIISTLQRYTQEGFTLILRSDQTKAWKLDMIRSVVNELEQEGSFKLHLLISFDKATHKPNSSLLNFPITPDSIHVGDAAGRTGDWSAVDKSYATNLNISFMTPEEFFGSQQTNVTLVATFNITSVEQREELVLMCGLPGSGKSTFAKQLLSDYMYISLDEHNKLSSKKLLSWLETLYQQGTKSIVVDACHATAKARQAYMDLATKLQWPVRVFWLTTTLEQALKNNDNRKATSGYVSRIAIYTCNKRFEVPTSDEHVSVVRVEKE